MNCWGLANRWVLGTLGAACAAASFAATEAEILLVQNAVRSQFPSFADYCKQTDDAKRQLVTQATLKLMGEKKISDPFGAGPAAGAALRKTCGLDATPMTPAQTRWLVTAKPLAFEAGFKTLGTFTTAIGMANQVYVPDAYKPADGPLPAVVLNHTIGGVSAHLKTQARALLDAGYAVLVVDSFGPRSLKPGLNLPPSDVAKDAYDALAHLQAQPFVDKKRVFQSGYSLGALAAALLASPESAAALKSGDRFRATVSHYGSCGISGWSAPVLSADSDRPVLMLMGELDIETPAKTCFPLLEQMKAAGKPVQWHVYPNISHAWDKLENNGYVYSAPDGQTMTYRYDETVTKDALARMIAFFKSQI